MVIKQFKLKGSFGKYWFCYRVGFRYQLSLRYQVRFWLIYIIYIFFSPVLLFDFFIVESLLCFLGSCFDIKGEHVIFGFDDGGAVESTTIFNGNFEDEIGFGTLAINCFYLRCLVILFEFLDKKILCLMNFKLTCIKQLEIKFTILPFCKIKNLIPMICFRHSFSIIINKVTSYNCRIRMFLKEWIFQIIRSKS